MKKKYSFVFRFTRLISTRYLFQETVLLFYSFILLLMWSPDLQGQKYIPLAVDQAQWIIRSEIVGTPWLVDGLWEYYANGDTSINEVSYTKIYKRLLVVSQDPPPFEPDGNYELYACLRDDTLNRKVYAIEFNTFNNCPSNEEYLMYDFDLEIGDTANFCLFVNYNNYAITSIDETDYLGFNTRVFSNNFGDIDYYEGMGSYFGLFEDMFIPVKSIEKKDVYSTSLYYYCRGPICGLVVSVPENNLDNEFNLSPNPAHEKIQLIFSSEFDYQEIVLFDIQGVEKDRFMLLPNISEYELDISSFTSGMYLLVLIHNKQVIKKHKILIFNP